MSKWIKNRASIPFLLVTILILCFEQGRCFSAVKDMTQALPDDYLGTEFNWAMILDLPDVNYYLKYPASKLWPLTKVHIDLRAYSQDKNNTPPTNTFYEEFWYHKQAPVGLRRYNQISITKQSNGAIIVCPGDITADLLQRAPAIADAIVRLVVDIQFRNAVVALVLVPQYDYDNVAEALSQYNFFVGTIGSPIRPLAIHLRAYPEGKDEMFYFIKK
jgi:hypothetical protein